MTVAGGTWYGSIFGTSVERSSTPIKYASVKFSPTLTNLVVAFANFPSLQLLRFFGAPAAGGSLFGSAAPAASPFGAPSVAHVVPAFSVAPSPVAHFQLELPFPVRDTPINVPKIPNS